MSSDHQNFIRDLTEAVDTRLQGPIPMDLDMNPTNQWGDQYQAAKDISGRLPGLLALARQLGTRYVVLREGPEVTPEVLKLTTALRFICHDIGLCAETFFRPYLSTGIIPYPTVRYQFRVYLPGLRPDPTDSLE